MMWWLALAMLIIIVCCASYKGYYRNKYDEYSKEYKLREVITDSVYLLSSCSFIFIFCLFFIVLIYGIHTVNTEDYPALARYKEVFISALEDNLTVNGKMYFRSGYIDEDIYYYYMKVLPNGNVILDKVKAEETEIIKSSSDYKIEYYKSSKIFKDKLFGGFLNQEDSIYHYKLYVPEGTVSEEYNIDLH